ncbi:hypothetical protein [Neisseria weixii]|uniref:hypothetical protein n=1 Tax=Neisseria weixii TaxID=1853276 RepID=UPI0035A18CE2
MNASDINRLNEIEAKEALDEEIAERAERIIETCHIEELRAEATLDEWRMIEAIAERVAAKEIFEEVEYEAAEQEYRRREENRRF